MIRITGSAVPCCIPAVVALAVVLSGCSGGSAPKSGGPKRIVILTNGTSPFWDAGAAGANSAKKDLKLEEAGFTVDFDRGDYKVEDQLNKLRQYVGSSDVAGLAISVTDAKSIALVNELRTLQKSGVKVVTIDSDVNRATGSDARSFYLGTDNVVAGRELGRAAQGLKPDGARYATFVGLKGAANAVERIDGFAEGAGKSFQSVQSVADGGDPERARTNVRDALDQHPEINMLVGIWSYNTPAIVGIVKELKVRDKVTVVGFDADPPTIDGMQQGFVDVIVVQNPYEMGYQGVRILKALIEDDQGTIKQMFPNQGTDNGDLYDTRLKVVVPDGPTPLKPELLGSKAQFLRLAEFKTWLNKYGLTGS